MLTEIRPPYNVTQLRYASAFDLADFRARLLAGNVYAVDDEDKEQIAMMAAQVGVRIEGYNKHTIDSRPGDTGMSAADLIKLGKEKLARGEYA